MYFGVNIRTYAVAKRYKFARINSERLLPMLHAIATPPICIRVVFIHT